VAAYPQLIAAHVGAPFVTLGTDGFGRSDTRAALRRFFEVDRHHVVVAALRALQQQGVVEAAVVEQAIVRYGLQRDAAPPWNR
jgi:pyruvate dehydrogenase E1 component